MHNTPFYTYDEIFLYDPIFLEVGFQKPIF